VVILDTTRPTASHGTPARPAPLRAPGDGLPETAFDQYQDDEYVATFAPPRRPAGLTAPEAVAAASPPSAATGRRGDRA
jgi:hypothetical protein